jgi:hypothetical protein
MHIAVFTYFYMGMLTLNYVHMHNNVHFMAPVRALQPFCAHPYCHPGSLECTLLSLCTKKCKRAKKSSMKFEQYFFKRVKIDHTFWFFMNLDEAHKIADSSLHKVYSDSNVALLTS